MAFAAHCPVPKCERKTFTGSTREAVLALIRKHLQANSADPNHTDIADLEGWFDTDPLGD